MATVVLIEGIISIFDDFAARSGLHISIEKSTLYLAGISADDQAAITTSFLFATDQFPVRYLGLPLLTKRVTKADYAPLVERIRWQMCSWKFCFLSFAGRLQLLKSVITSIVNFWLSAFRLPNGCIDEIEKLCEAFLWSGPTLNTKKSKIAWKDVCMPKQEGGIGIKSIKEANRVACLNLIWRLLSGDSLWVKWLRLNLLKQKPFWSVPSSTVGSWMWNILLKYRDFAKDFHRRKFIVTTQTSFWYDDWSDLGRLIDLTGTRGFIDMGIPTNASVATTKKQMRPRSHRSQILNEIDVVLANIGVLDQGDRDVDLWKIAADKYSKTFNSNGTWNLLRHHSPITYWSSGIWFKYATPKFSFVAWLALHNRLATGDRMLHWNTGHRTGCILCEGQLETHDHLFFTCPLSAVVWKALTSKLLARNH